MYKLGVDSASAYQAVFVEPREGYYFLTSMGTAFNPLINSVEFGGSLNTGLEFESLSALNRELVRLGYPKVTQAQSRAIFPKGIAYVGIGGMSTLYLPIKLDVLADLRDRSPTLDEIFHEKLHKHMYRTERIYSERFVERTNKALSRYYEKRTWPRAK